MTYDPFRSPAPWRHQFDNARDPYTARNTIGAVDAKYVTDAIAAGGGGGGGAPTNAEYITAATDPTLTNERVLTNTATVTWDFSTAGQAKATATGGVPIARTITAGAGLFGGGDLSADRIIDVGSGEGIQTGANNVNLDFNGLVEMTLAPDPGDFLCAYHLVATAHRKVKVSNLGFQPLDGDLTAIAALTGTNTIYYRSAADTWSAVTIGSNLTFTAGTLAASGGGTATATMPQGRLTLQTATPVMTTTQSAKTTIFYALYVGNLVPIWDGTTMTMTTFAELSNVTTASSTGKAGPAAVAASSVYDLFVWSDAGTVRLTRGPAWTSDTARSAGTALTLVNGIYLNNASITNGPAASRGTYVGTVRSNASSQLNFILPSSAAGGTAGVFGVWNCYNRVMVGGESRDTTSSWSYSSTTIRAKNNSTGNAISFVSGLQEDVARATNIHGLVTSASDGSTISAGIGVDTTSAHTSTVTQGDVFASGAGYPHAHYVASSLGYHTWTATEACNGATSVTTTGTATSPTRNFSALIFSFLM